MTHFICVWTDTKHGWTKLLTNERLGTSDEFLFFRVISDGHKEFFDSPHDYVRYSGAKVTPEFAEVAEQWRQRVAAANDELPSAE